MIRMPINIVYEMLSPTDKTNISVNLRLLGFNMQRKSIPGINARVINPSTCLKKGIFKKIEISVEMRNTNSNEIGLIALYRVALLLHCISTLILHFSNIQYMSMRHRFSPVCIEFDF